MGGTREERAAEFPHLLLEGEPRSFGQGDVIFEEGDAPDVMFAVKKGEVSIRIGAREIETVGPNGLFGEMALIDDAPRSATALARTDCQLVPVDRRRFEHLVERWPGFALTVMKMMVDRIRRADRA